MCLGGVGVGVMALIIVISVMNGFGSSIRERLFLVEPHLVVRFPHAWSDQEVKVKRQGLVSQIKDQVASISPYERQDVILRTRDGYFNGAVARGLEAPALHSLLEGVDRIHHQESAQVAEEELNTPLQGRELMLGVELARSLNLFVGDNITIISPEALLLPIGEVPPYERVAVSRILRTNVPDVDQHGVFYSSGTVLHRLKESASRENGLDIKLRDAYQFEDLRNQLRTQGWDVESWQDRNAALFFSLKMEKLLMSTFLGLTVLVACFSIVIVLVLLGIQKRRDIGMLMTMGLSRKRTRSLFTKIGMTLAGFGMFGGLSIGLIICWIGGRYQFIKLPDIYYDTRIPFEVDYNWVAGIIVIGGLVAFLASFLPAWWATRSERIAALSRDGFV
jgi:lipoprotein-releasing system permease protein